MHGGQSGRAFILQSQFEQFNFGHRAIRLALSGPVGAGRNHGRRRAGGETEAIFLPAPQSSLPSALLTFIFVCSMHADLKEGIGKDSLPKQTNKQNKKETLLS